MAVAEIQANFSGGELSPALYARVDLAKYETGAALIRNFICDYRGGVAYRPGFEFISDVSDMDGPWLAPFIVSTQASYVLIFGDTTIRFITGGVMLESSPGVPYEVTTPYAAADLPLLKWAQSADVMTLTHPSYPPANLSRTSASTFTYTPIAVGPTIGPPTITTFVTPHDGAYNFGYLVTAVDLDGKEESLPSNIGVKQCEGMNELTNRVLGLSWTAPSEAVQRYNVYKWGPIDAVTMIPATAWGFIGTAQTVTFSDINIAPDFTKQPPIWGDPFSGGQFESIVVATGGSGYDGVAGDWPVIPYVPLDIVGDGSGAAGWAVIDHANGEIIGAFLTNAGRNYTTATITADGEGGSGATFTYTLSAIEPLYPSTVSYVQQRRVFAGSNLKPESFAMSQPGRYDNFNSTPVALATDAIGATVSSLQVNTIKSLVPVSYGLLAFTTGGCYLIGSTDGPTGSISPATISVTQQASPGSNDIPPLLVNYDIVFNSAKGNRVLSAGFAWERQSYTVKDTSQLAPHLFDSFTTVQWCWQESPFKSIWVVRDDGRLLSMTYVPEEQVYAWTRHDTQGLFKSICSVPENGEDAIYVVVQRHVDNGSGDGCWVNYVERLATRNSCCIFDAFHLDSGLSLARTPGDQTIYITGDTATVGADVSLYTYDPCGPASGGFGGEGLVFDGLFVTSVSNALAFAIGTVGDFMDQHGNAWTAGNHVTGGGVIQVIDQTGTIIDDHTAATMYDDIIDFANLHGGSFSHVGLSDNGFALCTVNYEGVYYILTMLHKYMDTGSSFYDLVGVSTANADGTFTVEAAAWTVGRSTFDSRCFKIDLAGMKTFDDEVVIQMGTESDYGVPSWTRFPSINAMIAQLGGSVITEFHNNADVGVGEAYRQFGLPPMNAGCLGTNAGGIDQASFLMPDGSGGTDICVYLSSACVSLSGVPQAGIIAATYPDGVLCKCTLPTNTVTFGVPSCPQGTSYVPLPEPGQFTDGTTPYNSFTDVGLYFDGSAGPPQLDYYGVPRLISTTATGWRVGWYAPWFTDTSYDGSTNWTVKEKLRVMDFDATTGVYTDVVVLEGATAPILSIGDRQGAGQDAIDINGWALFEQDGGLFIWHEDGGSGGDSGTYFTWLSQVGASVPVALECIWVGCGEIMVTEVVSATHLIGEVIHPLDILVPNGPEGELLNAPVPAEDWFLVTPTQVVSGLDHLEGKEVMALADGLVVGPMIVANGSVDLGFEVCSAVVGLQYTGQVKTLYLTAEGINQGTEQGKRKLLPAATLRVDCTRGLKAGHDFDSLSNVPDLIGAGTNTLFTGDARVLLGPLWDTKGEVCIQQDVPLPAQILGVIPEVAPGDTGR